MAAEYSRPTISRFQFPLKNRAYGFPRGQERPKEEKPTVLICIHITGNRNTASMPVGIGKGTGTRAEVEWLAGPRNDPDDLGNSAHDYIARDGSILRLIPTKFAAWNNGGLSRENKKLKSIRTIAQDSDTKGINANRAYLREVECTGSPGRWALTKNQRETLSYLIAKDSRRSGLEISRETVHLHADLDGVNRRRCPFTASEKWGTIDEQVGAIIARAREIKKAMLADGSPDEDPDEEHDEVAEELTEDEVLRAQLAAAEGEIQELRRDRRRLKRVIDRLTAAATDDEVAKVLDDIPDDAEGEINGG